MTAMKHINLTSHLPTHNKYLLYEALINMYHLKLLSNSLQNEYECIKKAYGSCSLPNKTNISKFNNEHNQVCGVFQFINDPLMTMLYTLQVI